MSFEEERREIDRIDREILSLLLARLRTARKIGERKRQDRVGSYDPMREKEVLERVVREAGESIPAESLRAIYREIISASRALETRKPVLFLGSRGSLAHQAARERFGDSARLLGEDDLFHFFERIEAKEADYAVLSPEASSFEAHLDRFDPFLHSPVRIFGEFYVSPRIARLSSATHPPRAGAGAGEAVAEEIVFADPAVLARCARWVRGTAASRRFHVVGTPEEAAQRAAAGEGSALGYDALRALAPLVPLESGLEDEAGAPRRFLIAALEDGSPSGRDKTSCLAVIPNRPGALHDVTGALAQHGVNLCWIEPKTTPIGAWDHIFFLDLEGHREEARVAEAIEAMRARTEWLRVLGSYPSERPPGRSVG
ncbi:MAG: bifunctional chorismate mutase/prephenate dehydratase [Candidatus Eisenbacteria bacterium]